MKKFKTIQFKYLNKFDIPKRYYKDNVFNCSKYIYLDRKNILYTNNYFLKSNKKHTRKKDSIVLPLDELKKMKKNKVKSKDKVVFYKDSKNIVAKINNKEYKYKNIDYFDFSSIFKDIKKLKRIKISNKKIRQLKSFINSVNKDEKELKYSIIFKFQGTYINDSEFNKNIFFNNDLNVWGDIDFEHLEFIFKDISSNKDNNIYFYNSKKSLIIEDNKNFYVVNFIKNLNSKTPSNTYLEKYK